MPSKTKIVIQSIICEINLHVVCIYIYFTPKLKCVTHYICMKCGYINWIYIYFVVAYQWKRYFFVPWTLLWWIMVIFPLQIISSSGARACSSFPSKLLCLITDSVCSSFVPSGSDSAQKDRPKQRPIKVWLQGQHSLQTGWDFSQL